MLRSKRSKTSFVSAKKANQIQQSNYGENTATGFITNSLLFITCIVWPATHQLTLHFQASTMKDFISKPDTFRKIEFWAVTTTYVFAVFFLINAALGDAWSTSTVGVESLGHYYFVSKLLRYTILYLAFITLNFKIVPKLIQKESLWLNIISTLLIFFCCGFAVWHY